MRHRPLAAVLGLAILTVAGAPSDPAVIREDAYRANNRGVALLEQYKAEEAVKAFREALTLDPKISLARVNLAIALLNSSDTDGAEREAKAALEAAPDSLQAWYVRGLVARSQNRADDARAAFLKVVAGDSTDVGSRVNLGQLALLARDYDEAITQFRAATEAEPYNGSALYNLGIALVRSGKAEEGQKTLDKFQALKAEGAATMIGQTYPEQGRYAEAVLSTGNEPDLVEPSTPAVRFRALSPEKSPANDLGESGSGLLFDWNGDGALDILTAVVPVTIVPGTPAAPREPPARGIVRLFENRQGTFVEIVERGGLPGTAPAFAAIAADIDNDKDVDVLLLTARGPRLFRREDAAFVETTKDAGMPAAAAMAGAFADLDHDGDADLVLGRSIDGGTVRVLQNDGQGKFADQTEAVFASHSTPRASVVMPTDFDNRRDMDLVFVDRWMTPVHAPSVFVFQNQRDRTFRNIATHLGLDGVPANLVSGADVNKDGFADLYLSVGMKAAFAMSDGRGGFRIEETPARLEDANQALFLDYDNDGTLDLLLSGARGGRLFRNVGRSWTDVTTESGVGELGVAAYPVVGDVDADGDSDIVGVDRTGTPRLLRNEGGNKNHSLTVDLQGFVSNRSGIGAKVEVRAGSLHQKIETSSTFPPIRPADVIFGLGQRPEADAVRVIWPSGTMQAEAPEPKATTMKIVELDRKPSSCPYLYAWNGSRFDFVTDFMGGGEMGYQFPNGAWNMPDPTEYVRLTDQQLRARNGRYEIRVTNELEELLFVDRLRLMAVDHAASVEVHPNEGMTSKPPPFRLIAATGLRVPRSATDDAGHDVLDLVARLDDRSPSNFALAHLRGYAADHALTLDLGGGAADRLFLTAWTDYAFSSDNVAAGQAGMAMHPPSLQMRNGKGEWQTVITEVGIPVGRPQTIALDLADRWLSNDRHVRIVTNMRIYWDQVQVGSAAPNAGIVTKWLDPVMADLRERGFSAEQAKAAPQRSTFDYTRVSAESPWKVFPGRYTRLGDVRELLQASDDVFVFSKPGDELAVSFDAAALPALKPGVRRTFLLFSDGYSKEMDINSATPDTGAPLPFHAMSRYPYGPNERFPMTPEKERLVDKYNTRVIRREIPFLVAAEARTPSQ